MLTHVCLSIFGIDIVFLLTIDLLLNLVQMVISLGPLIVSARSGLKVICHAFAGDNMPNGLKRCTL